MRISDRLEALAQDLRYALRGVRREPAFAVFIVLTLALGIGANAAMFGVVDRLFLRGPEHVVEPGRLVRLYASAVTPWAGEHTWSSAGYVRYLLTRENAQSFSDVAAYAINEATIGRGAEARPIRVGWVTADFFGTTGVRPAHGRFFTWDEDAPASPRRVAVIAFHLWQGEYGGGGIDGATIVLNGELYDIVGVAPRGFTGVELAPVDVWTPMSIKGAATTPNWERGWDAQWLRVIGRLKPGVTLDAATDDATAVHRGGYAGGQQWERDARVLALPISASSTGAEVPEARVARWLIGVTVIVLVIACANTANLLLARVARRRRELAVRIALGSGRARLARLLLAEGVTLGVAGGAAGIAVAYVVGTVVRQTLLPNIAWTTSPVGWRVIVVAALVAVCVGLLVGVLPALQAGSRGLAASLRAGVREGGGRRATLRGALTVTQAALSVVLLVGAGLFVQSLRAIARIEMGLEPDRVVVASVPAPGDGADRPESLEARIARRRQFALAVLDSVRRVPGVEHASLAVGLAFNSAFGVGLRVPGLDSIPSMPGGGPYIHAVTSGYFETMGGRILRGRAFTTADREGSERVVIVSALMAETLWPGADALGHCMMIGDEDSPPCSRVVGIAANAHRDGLREAPAMAYYIPFGQETGIGGTALLVRPRAGTAALFAPIRQVIRAMNPTANYIRVATLQESLDPQIRPWRLGATMFALCGVLALVVAAVGLYSVMSYAVVQRTHEFAVRSALGARPADIVRLILTGGLGLAALGVVAGLVPAWLGARWLEPLLFETSARDPGVYAGVAIALLLVAGAACVLPALRANRVQPVSALKAD